MYDNGTMKRIEERHKSFWDEFNKSQEQIKKNLAESEKLHEEINRELESIDSSNKKFEEGQASINAMLDSINDDLDRLLNDL